MRACSHHGRPSLIDSCTRGSASIHFSACIAKDRVWGSPWAVHSKVSLQSLQTVGRQLLQKLSQAGTVLACVNHVRVTMWRQP